MTSPYLNCDFCHSYMFTFQIHIVHAKGEKINILAGQDVHANRMVTIAEEDADIWVRSIISENIWHLMEYVPVVKRWRTPHCLDTKKQSKCSCLRNGIECKIKCCCRCCKSHGHWTVLESNVLLVVIQLTKRQKVLSIDTSHCTVFNLYNMVFEHIQLTSNESCFSM